MEHLFHLAKRCFFAEMAKQHRLDAETVHRICHAAASAVLPSRKDAHSIVDDNSYVLDVYQNSGEALEVMGLPNSHEGRVLACIYWHLYQDLQEMWEKMNPEIVTVVFCLDGDKFQIIS